MNYLAHLFLSPENHQVRVGNLMGDFVKGSSWKSLPPNVVNGIKLHRAIDKYTDAHPAVIELKRHLSLGRKRFSGIISDIVFDHLLARFWCHYSDESLTGFAERCYSDIAFNRNVLPPLMRSMTDRMIAGNWLEQYQHESAINGAINGVSRRIRFENKLFNAAEEVLPLLREYQNSFEVFFPQLQSFVALEIEQMLIVPSKV